MLASMTRATKSRFKKRGIVYDIRMINVDNVDNGKVNTPTVFNVIEINENINDLPVNVILLGITDTNELNVSLIIS